tara:strand:- start:12678 stop:13130 length:453 start_codon:yes stop_codon:yes gene_type:complete
MTPAVTKPRRKIVNTKIRLTKEDHAFVTELRKSCGISLSVFVSRMITLLCRTVRTGRDPVTGEAIDWRAAYRLDIDVAKKCHKAIQELRMSPSGPNDTVQAIENAALALKEMAVCFEAARMADRDKNKPNRKVEDPFLYTENSFNAFARK